MTAVEQAAEIIAADYRARHSGFEWGPAIAAQALADAGLLVTDEIHAVLDATVALKQLPVGSQDYSDRSRTLGSAVDAFLAARSS